MGSLGFDFGSVSVKGALLDGQGRIRLCFSRERGPEEAAALARFLDDLERLQPDLQVRLGCTGFEGLRQGEVRAAQVNPILAVGAGVRALHGSARTIIEVGGQSAKFLVLGAGGALEDFATNEACAAGTGAFLEQQARRLGLSAEELSGLAVQAGRPATIAGRCSVFAASDMIHLQQKGTPLAELAYGLCLAIARNYLSSLLKGRAVGLPVVLAGGCARNLGIVRAFRAMLEGGSADTVRVSAAPGLEGAVGAALGAAGGPLLGLRQVRAVLAELAVAGQVPDRVPFRPLQPPEGGPGPLEPQDGNPAGAAGYLGIDVGSVSTDLVLVDAAGEVVSSVYLPTQGRPVAMLRKGLDLLKARFGGRLQVLGCGTTGSGRHLAGKLVGADVVKNEITCQLLGAQRYVPDVDTIFEIGGQDAKFIAVRAGAMADFAMNKVCAAGTGSFLEERAEGLGVAVRGDFAAQAFRSAAPLDLGSRCTVFMETEVAKARARGGSVADLCAGLAYAIARNYLDKVVGNRPLGQRIVFQGGVASNGAVVAAFGNILGRPVQVHPWNRISGAIGAALAARAAVSGPSAFTGMADGAEPALASFECQQCANRCDVNVIGTGAGRAFFGDTCERYTSGAAGASCAVPNLAQEYLDRCAALCAPGAPGLPRIGLPRASSLMGDLPFWAAFWRALGYQPVLAPPTSQATLALGHKHLAVGVCLPIKLAVGHFHALLDQGLDRVFVPSVVHFPGEDSATTHACQYTMAVPFLIDDRDPGGARRLSPAVSFASEEAFVAGLAPCLGTLDRNRVVRAYRSAVAVQGEVQAAFRRRAADLLEAGGWRQVFGILGRPYTVLDSFANLGLFERLRRMGVLALPMAFLVPEGVPAGAGPELPWRYPHDLCRGAARLARAGPVHPVIVTNYGCGPDAFTLQRLGGILRGRPQLVLELDEHRGEAGLVTRIEAFLDQLETARDPLPVPGPDPLPAGSFLPAVPSAIRIPYFADQAYAYSGVLKFCGHEAQVLPLPGPATRALGEQYALGKECHAYAMLLGDLLRLGRGPDGTDQVFFFPGTSLPCLLHEFGQGMQTLLGELGIGHLRVSAPTGPALAGTLGLKAMERFYTGLLAIEILDKAVCQIRPYELDPGATDVLHARNLERIEAAVAHGDVLAALDESLRLLSMIPRASDRERPVVGLVGDLYTRVNPVANQDLVRWLEAQGLEVWPSPFQIDLLDFDISRNLFHSLETLDLHNLLLHGKIALLRAIHLWRIRSVVGSRVARQAEPGYLETRRLASAYMPNEANELLFLHVAKTVDFARSGVDGIVNAICFGCMVGNAAAALTERIRRDFDNLPILTAVYAGGDDPTRRMALEAFVSQVRAHRQRSRPPVAAG